MYVFLICGSNVSEDANELCTNSVVIHHECLISARGAHLLALNYGLFRRVVGRDLIHKHKGGFLWVGLSCPSFTAV